MTLLLAAFLLLFRRLLLRLVGMAVVLLLMLMAQAGIVMVRILLTMMVAVLRLVLSLSACACSSTACTEAGRCHQGGSSPLQHQGSICFVLHLMRPF